MALTQPSHVRKQDGRLVPFDVDKLTRSIQAAARECGVMEEFYAREIAEAVSLHLAKKYNAMPPETTELFQAVEKVLYDTRHTQICYAYRSFRVERERNRRTCKVLKTVQPSLLDADVSVLVTSHHEQRSHPWNRTSIIRALEHEARIPHIVAEEISRSVEEKVLNSGLSRVTTTLIRAITDNELLIRGYSNLLRQRSSVTIPFDDLEKLLHSGHTAALPRMLGSQAIPSYTLTHLYSDDVAMAYRRGLIHISGLHHPFSLYHDTYDVFSGYETQRQYRHTFQNIITRLESGQLGRVTCRLTPDEPVNKWCPRIIECIDYASALEGDQRLTFEFDCREAFTVANLFGTLEPLPSLLIKTSGPCDDHETLTESLLELFQQGWPVAWDPSPSHAPLSQLLSINLPQTVYRARQHDLDGVIEELYRTIDVIIQAHRQYCFFARAHHFNLPANHSAAVDILGLEEAVAILTGSGMFEQTDNDACERVLLRVLHEMLHQAGTAYGLNFILHCGDPNPCGKRFATIDQSLFPELFGFLPLSPDSLEHVIPAYSTVELPFNGTLPSNKFIGMAQTIRRYFDSGVIAIKSTNSFDDMLSGLVQTGIGFRLTPHQDIALQTASAEAASPALPGLSSQES